MLKSKLLFFLLFLVFSIFCQERIKTSTGQEQKSLKETNSTNETDSEVPLNITMDEKDTIMICALIVQESLKKYEKDVEKLSKKFNISKINIVYDKVGTEIFENCYKEVKIDVVNTYMKNLTYFYNFAWEKSFDKFTKVDFDKYKNKTDLDLTLYQKDLIKKYDKVNDIFKNKNMARREEIENQNKRIRIGKIDMDNLPIQFKLGVFLVMMMLIFGGLFYFLKTLQKKPIEKKKKEKKKKTQ